MTAVPVRFRPGRSARTRRRGVYAAQHAGCSRWRSPACTHLLRWPTPSALRSRRGRDAAGFSAGWDGSTVRSHGIPGCGGTTAVRTALVRSSGSWRIEVTRSRLSRTHPARRTEQRCAACRQAVQILPPSGPAEAGAYPLSPASPLLGAASAIERTWNAVAPLAARFPLHHESERLAA